MRVNEIILESTENIQSTAAKLDAKIDNDANLLSKLVAGIQKNPNLLSNLKEENIEEDWKKTLGTAALAGSLALGAGAANAGHQDATYLSQCAAVSEIMANSYKQKGDIQTAQAAIKLSQDFRQVASIFVGRERANGIAIDTYRDLLHMISTQDPAKSASQVAQYTRGCLAAAKDIDFQFLLKNAPR